MSQPIEKKDKLEKLCKDGVIVTFETIGTVHQCALFEGEGEDETDSSEAPPTASLQWEVLGYGIPVIIANENGVVLCLADIESGDKLCEFSISSSSQYVALDNHFHIITERSGCYGISYANDAVSKKILVYLKRVISCISVGEEEEEEPTAKQRRFEADATDTGTEEVDGPFNRRKSLKRPRKELVISEPQDYQHISHIGVDSSITQLMMWSGTLQDKQRSATSGSISIPMYNCKEYDTISTTSFEESRPPPPPGPPPPPAPPPPSILPPPAKIVLPKKRSALTSPASDLMSSLADEIKKGVVLRPVGSDKSSMGSETSQKSTDSLLEELKKGVVLRTVVSGKVMTLPAPPRRNRSEKLLFEISTFRRNKLRHVSANMTDFPAVEPDEKSLESVMKRGLASMLKKMSDVGVRNIGHVSEGNDAFDGLFSSDE